MIHKTNLRKMIVIKQIILHCHCNILTWTNLLPAHMLIETTASSASFRWYN